MAKTEAKRYVPTYKEFLTPFFLLILGALMFLSAFLIESTLFKAILIIPAIIIILWSIARIIRIFLKIFLQEIKGW